MRATLKNQNFDLLALLLCGFLLFVGCKKDTGKLNLSNEEPSANPIDTDPSFQCEDTKFDTTALPGEPPTGFNYVYAYGNKNIWRVIYDVTDRNLIYYLTMESSGNSNWLWKFNRSANTKTLLDKGIGGHLSINKNGWLAYLKMDKNVYKIKANGDSLKQLTYGSSSNWVRWSEDGLSLFVYNDNNPQVRIYRIRTDGTVIDTLKNMGSSDNVYQIKNFLYRNEILNNKKAIIRRDLTNGLETTVVSSPVNNLGGDIYDFYSDANNSNLFWYGDSGLYKTNLTTLQTVHLVKSGFYTRTTTAHYRQSPLSNRFIAILFTQKAISSDKILNTSTIVEYTEDGICRRSVEVP